MTDPALALTVALGCGMLLGVQRERRLGEESNRAAADVRTFALVGLAGGLAGGWAGLRQRPSRSASSRSQRLSKATQVAAAMCCSRPPDPGVELLLVVLLD
jgi:uncharacterized membrane protein YhiD involved in acid resistance